MNRETGKSKLEGTKGKFESIRETKDEIIGEAEQIDGLLDGINLEGCDADDVSALDGSKSGYSRDFGGAVSEQVEDPTNEGVKESQDDMSELNEGKEQVEAARSNFEQAAGVSDIGSSNAESGARQMEQSSNEYTEIIEGNQAAIDAAQDVAQDAASRLSDLFS